MNVIFSDRAEQDLCEIIDDLAEISPDTATALNEQFEQRLNQLSRLPRMGRPRPDIDEGLRGLLVSPYVLFYRILNNEIFVVRILHGKRDLWQNVNEEA